MMNPAMQAQYRYQQQTQRPPHGASGRKGAGNFPSVSHPNSAHTTAQHMAQRNALAVETEAAKRRAKKPTDKNIPDGVEDVVIGEGVQQYRALREIERKLDAAMMRKRLDLQDAKAQTVERTRRLRIWISNTVENQPWQGRGLDLDENNFDFSTVTEATYKVKIEGRLLDEDDPDDESDGEEDEKNGHAEADADAMDHDGQDQSSKKPKVSKPRRKLSWFFKSITVEYDRPKNHPSDNATLIEWKKPQVPLNITDPPAAADFDTLEFERKSDENINCTINLYRDEVPERFTMSKDLADLIDREDGTRETIITGIWDYVKAMGLQEDEEKRIIQCDERLRKMFKSDTIFFPQINDLLAPHLSPLRPVKLPYTIRVDPEYQNAPTPTIYDILVPAESPLRAKVLVVTQNQQYIPTLRQIATLDDQLAVMVQAINHSKAKHSFFTGMSKDPANFVRKWTSSQKYDYNIILGESTKGGDALEDEFRRGGRGGVWGSENVRESVGLMMAKRSH